MVECSPASEKDCRPRAARVRFPADAAFFFTSFSSILALERVGYHVGDDDRSNQLLKMSKKRGENHSMLIQ